MRKRLYWWGLLSLFLLVLIPGWASLTQAVQSGQVQNAELKGFVYADGGYVQALSSNSPGFSSNFNANGYGSFGWQFTNTAGSTLQNARFVVFLDADLDRDTTTFFNEYGSLVSLSLPPQAASNDIAPTGWEIDEPSFLFGDLAQHLLTGVLDQTNSIPASAPDDVALALSFPLGTVPPNTLTSSFFFISQTDIGGLSQTDNISNAKFWLNGYIRANSPPQIAAATITRQQGSPSSVATIATVSDGESPVDSLVVTATTVPAGISITSITNTAGTITANIAASCTAAIGANTIILTVTDGNGGMTTGNLTVNVAANASPSLSYPITGVALNGATTITPNTGSDNGSITGFSIVSVVPPLTTAPTVNASGVVSVTNAAPFGLHTVTVRATDNCGATTDTSFTLNVGCGGITVTPATLINGLTFVPYSSTLSASGGSGSYVFSLASGTLPAGLILSGNTIFGTPNTAGASTFTIRATDDNGCIGQQTYTLLIGSTGLMYYPLARPVRLLDTRPGVSPNACFQPNAPIPGGIVRLQPARGTCEGLTIPANAATITGNVTAVQPSGTGFLTIYPSDAPQPLVANTNFQPNENLNNSFTVGVGAQDGAVKIFVSSTTDVVVDVTGYYAPPGTGGLYFHPLPRPVRLLETRAGNSGCYNPASPLPGGQNRLQQGTGACDGLTIPPEAQALVGNATTVNSQGFGYLTLYPAGAPQPYIASSNYRPGKAVNGPFTVGLSLLGQFNIFPLQTTDLVIDITGYYSAQANDVNGPGLLFTSLGSPLRLLDTRAGQQGCYTPGAPMTAGTVYTQQTQSPCTNLTPTARALIGNATVVGPDGNGYLTFWPGDAVQPLVATSNYTTGQVFNRYFTVGLAADGSFKRFASRTTELVVDISGFFAP